MTVIAILILVSVLLGISIILNFIFLSDGGGIKKQILRNELKLLSSEIIYLKKEILKKEFEYDELNSKIRSLNALKTAFEKTLKGLN